MKQSAAPVGCVPCEVANPCKASGKRCAEGIGQQHTIIKIPLLQLANFIDEFPGWRKNSARLRDWNQIVIKIFAIEQSRNPGTRYESKVRLFEDAAQLTQGRRRHHGIAYPIRHPNHYGFGESGVWSLESGV